MRGGPCASRSPPTRSSTSTEEPAMCFKELSRRSLFRAGAGVAGLSVAARFGLPRALAAASPANGRRFVFLYIPGGWDQLLVWDPRPFEVNASQAAYAAEVARTGIDTSYKYGVGSLDGRYVPGGYFKPTVYTPMGAGPD